MTEPLTEEELGLSTLDLLEEISTYTSSAVCYGERKTLGELGANLDPYFEAHKQYCRELVKIRDTMERIDFELSTGSFLNEGEGSDDSL